MGHFIDNEPLDPGQVDEFLIIGPPKSGKTSMLAVLETAATLASKAKAGTYTIFPEGGDMERLFQCAAAIGDSGKLDLPAGNEVSRYQFLLRAEEDPPNPAKGFGTLRPPRLPQSRIRDHRFRMMDGKGESLFGYQQDDGDLEQQDKSRETLIELGRKSQGLIICLDPSDPQSGGMFFAHLLPIFRAMATNFVLPFERVAIVLTKADRMFAEHRKQAEEKAGTADPWDQAEHVLGEVGIRNLLKYIDRRARPAVHCGWASVYGFVPGEGVANYNDETDTLLVFSKDDPQFFQRWRPFRVLDPFVYVATEEPMALQPIPKRWL